MTTSLRHAHISTDVLRHAYEVDQLSLRAIAKRYGFVAHCTVHQPVERTARCAQTSTP